jgi:hypothetical protein
VTDWHKLLGSTSTGANSLSTLKPLSCLAVLHFAEEVSSKVVPMLREFEALVPISW